MGRPTMTDTETSALAEGAAAIREDERKRLAAAIEANAETIADFAGGKIQAVNLVAHLLRHHSARPELSDAADALHDSGGAS